MSQSDPMRSVLNLVRLTALGVAGIAMLYACSDDKESTSGGSGGSTGGSGGTGATGGNGGSGGTSATGGSGGSAGGSGGSTGGSGGSTGGTGGSTGGSAGAAGAAGGPGTLGRDCLECGEEECGTLLAACGAVADCQSWLDCMAGCEDDACAVSCDLARPAMAHLTTPLYACLEANCSDTCDAIEVGQRTCENSLAPQETAPATLADTGLYVPDGSGGYELSPAVHGYSPKFELWADGALKQRFVYIPECERVDSNDMDNWNFPVGTRLFKQFSREPSGGGDPIKVETRMLHRFGPGASDWLRMTYQWDATDAESLENPSLALLVDVAGVLDANGTNHNIPSQAACDNCHGKLPSMILGFSAIQLSHDAAGVTMETLSEQGRITSLAPQGFATPGSAVERDALGTLHANCGHCHNDYFGASTLKMQLLVDQTTVEQTSTYQTAVDVAADNALYVGLDRMEPGDHTQSVIWVRMNTLEMPPGNAGNEVPNSEGLSALEAWAAALAE